MNTKCIYLSLAFLAMTITLISCTANPPQVFFTNIENGAAVSSPVQLTWSAENFAIEPAGEVRENAGHLHIMVDTDCLAPGEFILNDETHLHFGQAQTETELALDPGTHTLCLQAGDGTHFALEGEGMTQVIQIQVVE